YEPSISSSVSSQASVFSESCSISSSIASSVSDDFRLGHEEARDKACAQLQIQSQLSLDDTHTAAAPSQADCPTKAWDPPAPSYADVTSLPQEQRQNPRRSFGTRNQKPPALVRQDDRKSNFVESLVDSATQMVEVIWPLSVVPCRGEAANGRGVLPLRTYIEETLRRSRTSYSTLQVALYYLILIKPFVPKNDFTHEQQMDCPASRALMCGRRMFLAALILASKYLQDRNYSAKAWSRMSGLKITEINTNERTFLSKVNWKLHIPEPIFKRWAEIVIKHTPNHQPPSPGAPFNLSTLSWKSIVPLLTPELDTIPMPDTKARPLSESTDTFGLASPTTPTPTKGAMNLFKCDSTSHEGTPTPLTVVPRFLEPRPDLAPPTPALARMGPLPTPSMTPSSVAASTPAASVCSSRRPSICSAMAAVQRNGFNRCAVDALPFGFNTNKDNAPYGYLSRRPSITSAASSRSSPESMISDRSRTSRASSISSISTVSSTSSMAPNRACLARLATCRGARLPPPPATVAEEKEGSCAKPIVISDDVEMLSSPDPIDFTISEKVLHTPHKHSKHATQPALSAAAVHATEKSRKRGRTQGNRRSDLQEEVRLALEEAQDELMD
ncbi:hypothetical protein BDY17DRAFT_227984, partial [Neohortaea acidophila]